MPFLSQTATADEHITVLLVTTYSNNRTRMTRTTRTASKQVGCTVQYGVQKPRSSQVGSFVASISQEYHLSTAHVNCMKSHPEMQAKLFKPAQANNNHFPSSTSHPIPIPEKGYTPHIFPRSFFAGSPRPAPWVRMSEICSSQLILDV